MTDTPLDVRTMEVETRHGEMRRYDSPRTVHNHEDPCSWAPRSPDVTDLDTATVGVEVTLCDHCEWPDDAEAFLREQDSLWEGGDD